MTQSSTEVESLQPLKEFFGDIDKQFTVPGDLVISQGLHELESDPKNWGPLLASPPDLVRRFADCDLTGDCQNSQTAPVNLELPTGSSIPGDNRSQTDCASNEKVNLGEWTGRLFNSSKKSTTESAEAEKCEEDFRPIRDIFRLVAQTPLVRRKSSFVDEEV